MAKARLDDSKAASSTSPMALLLAKQKSVTALHKGDVIKGKIKKLNRHEILLDIQAKSDAFVVEKDRRLYRQLMEKLKVGDEVSAVVLNPESDMGYPLVTLRRFIEDQSWTLLEKVQKDQETVEVTVTEAIKGGFIVQAKNGISGFLPLSHVTFQQNQPMIGKQITVSLLELNRTDNKIIFSQKSALSEKDFSDATRELTVGKKLTTTITNVTPFGIFVALQPADKEGIVLDGLVHISEVAWEKVEDILGQFKAGEVIDVVVLKTDRDARRVDLSMKRLTADPFSEIAKQFPLDKRVTGIVEKIIGGTFHIKLSDSVEGIIRKEKVPPNMTITEGQSINAVVSEVDVKRRRIVLVPVLLEKPIGYR